MMKTIIHLSDIHFGRVNPALIDPLLQIVNEAKPDITVISGDLTQRATKKEFELARDFIKKLPGELIIVPGNHDQPLYNMFSRLRDPLKKFRHFITHDAEPAYKDAEVAVVGINTTRRARITDGWISPEQTKRVKEEFSNLGERTIKIVVSHHPFDMPEGFPSRRLVGRAGRAMRVFAEVGVDVLLAGHFHKKYIGNTVRRYNIKNHGALVIQAGTSASVRTRNEEPSFNILLIDSPHISIAQYVWRPEKKLFESVSEQKFIRDEHAWKQVD